MHPLDAHGIDNMSSTSGAPESWISSFCSLLGHEYFAEVSEEFIEDDFNLTGLQAQVAMYKEALEVPSPPPLSGYSCHRDNADMFYLVDDSRRRTRR